MTEPAFRRLFEPVTIANVTVRNRIVITPSGTMLPREREMDYYEARARGGVGLIEFAAGAGVHTYGVGIGPEGPDWDYRPPSPLTPRGVKFYDDAEIPGLRQYAELVHAHGAKGFAQIAHQGASNYRAIINPLVGPSNIATELDGITPHGLSGEEVEELIFCYAHSFRRIAESGLDGGEIHGGHGYLVSQFLSPYYNRRQDQWGGSTENRTRLPIEIIRAARKLVGPDFPIGIRISYEGTGEGEGITFDELVRIAKALEPHVSYLSVSGGNGSGLFRGLGPVYASSWYLRPAHNAAVAAAVKKAVNVPVILTGRIADPALAESLLADGSADMIGMVRALIADPELPNKAKRGDAGRQRMCIGLLECRNEGQYRTPVTCAVNAQAGRERELAIVPAETKKTVVVVGAGPAGMEAARVSAKRGHKVYLCDRESVIGGTPRVVSNDSTRRNLRDHSAFFETEFAELDVEMVLGHAVSADDVVAFGADAVVIATGGRAIIPDVPGIDRPNVMTALEALKGVRPVKKRVVVVAGSDNQIAAPSMADYFGERGHEVQLITEHLSFAWHLELGIRFALQARLHRKHIINQVATRLASVDDGAVLQDIFSGETRRVEDCTVVLACGFKQEDALYHALKGKIPELYVIGDAFAPRRVLHATVDAARTAVKI